MRAGRFVSLKLCVDLWINRLSQWTGQMMLRQSKEEMRANPRDNAGTPSRFNNAVQMIDSATKVAGLVHGMYQAGRVIAPLLL